MKKFIKILISTIILCLIGFIYYYNTLPAINIHSTGFWTFLIVVAILITVFVGIISAGGLRNTVELNKGPMQLNKAAFKGTFFKICSIITIGLVLVFIVGSILSSQIVNAKKYQQLIDINLDRDFKEDIKQLSYDKIPILDKASASLLGSRKMGSMVNYISQFEVAENYTQINYQNTPVRVTPLEYASLFKWFTNRSKGIPAYIRINMATQNAEAVQLEEGMKYSESEHFGRYIYRHLRFSYPTYIFDTINFEINDEGTPYWICPVKDYTIGLFGGQTISNVVIVNAITGEDTNYKIEDCPTWVDRVYSAELLVSYYDYYGMLKHGYLNTLFGQKDCLVTTEGYNYVALDDDVWVYTGVTSVVSDESLVGFVLMNQRTAETRYYPITGAKEYSAMSSAEGKVQHLGYKATFPLLLNISGEPTYFMALKDSAGLVKDYAMVNIAKYTIVAIGDTVTACEKDYRIQLKENNINVADTSTLPTATGVIEKIAEAVVDGNSHYYIMLQGNDKIFDVNVGEYLPIVKYNVGDMVTFIYAEGTDTNAVVGIK